MRRILSMLTLCAALSARAQTAVRGDSVRVTAPSLGMEKRVGTLVRATPDSLTFHQAGQATDTFTIANSVITHLQINYGGARHSNAGKSALYGGLIGGGVALAAGLAWNKCSGSCQDSGPYSTGAATLAGVVAGAGVGALIGLASHHTAWSDAKPGSITLSSLRLVPAWDPGRKTVGVAGSVRF